MAGKSPCNYRPCPQCQQSLVFKDDTRGFCSLCEHDSIIKPITIKYNIDILASRLAFNSIHEVVDGIADCARVFEALLNFVNAFGCDLPEAVGIFRRVAKGNPDGLCRHGIIVNHIGILELAELIMGKVEGADAKATD